MLYSMNSNALLILFGGYWNSELPYEPFNCLLECYLDLSF